MTAQEQAQNYELLKISIEGYLKAYQDILVDFEAELKEYQRLEMDSLIELKKEHCDTIKGKIEILTELNKK
jgi:predicted DNA-binding protein YlxM (UPF0122 family)